MNSLVQYINILFPQFSIQIVIVLFILFVHNQSKGMEFAIFQCLYRSFIIIFFRAAGSSLELIPIGDIKSRNCTGGAISPCRLKGKFIAIHFTGHVFYGKIHFYHQLHLVRFRS